MFRGVIFVNFLTHLHGISACLSNVNFTINGHLCRCDSQGVWTENNCKVITRKQLCEIGQTIRLGCNRCTCKVNGHFYCTSLDCRKQTIKSDNNVLSENRERCFPLQAYYVNCSYCICPASGLASESKCAMNPACYLDILDIDMFTIANRYRCLPNVIYVFPCIDCVCSADGILTKCTSKCLTQTKTKCISGTFYIHNDTICQCSLNSKPNERLCIKADINKRSKVADFNILRNNVKYCIPTTFTDAKCLFCDCRPNGTVDENYCLELDCTKTSNFKYYPQKNTCSPAELVPICIQCYCLSNGYSNATYCTRTCSYESRIKILDKVLNESTIDINVVDKSNIKAIERNNACQPNSIFINNSRYCLCPGKDEDVNVYCSSVTFSGTKSHVQHHIKTIKIDFNATCEPHSFIDFACNTCYCNKNGTVDPKWCTYDDCEAKHIVNVTTKTPLTQDIIDNKITNGTCVPGSISKVKCNYCICPESGKEKDRACTKNSCFGDIELTDEKFTCEPLSYYEVDCNICFCPRDGLKNVDKCTKEHCEKSFLRRERSNFCISGELFSEDCSVCVCPPNGDKDDKVCTNKTCHIRPTTFGPSSNLLHKIDDDVTRRLDVCFPGEEFSKGCNLCVCPELGLKVYATCEPILCDNKMSLRNFKILSETKRSTRATEIRIRRDIHDDCFIYNVSFSAERSECTPGSMYIIRCRQCICPYTGNINNFCRPLPKNFYCEEAFPGFNYLPMGRRMSKNDSSIEPRIATNEEKRNMTVAVKHNKHTIYRCHEPGKVEDECYICDCEKEKLIIIEEHCFKSDAENCVNAIPTFFNINKVQS